MTKKRVTDEEVIRSLHKGSTPAARENQVIAAAYDLAEKRILDGSASDTLLREFVKLGSPKEQIEREILERQRDLITAKTEAIQSQKRVDELYADALNVFKSYHGESDDPS